MAKAKKKKTQSDSKTHKPTAKDKRKKFWIKHNLKTVQKVTTPLKREEKAETQQTASLKGDQQFSSNWKALQELLKASQLEKRSPVTPKQNGVFFKKRTNTLKSVSKKDVVSTTPDSEKNQKHKFAPNNVPKEAGVNLNDHSALDTRQPAASKQKKNKGKSNNEPAAKRTKYVDEKRKPTEEDFWFDDVDPDDVEETIGAEAAEIMRRKQGVPVHKSQGTERSLVKENAFEGLTRAVAIDCEMVGIGPDGEDSMLARVSIVNHFGKCIYDKYVKPTERVTDYRTDVSGIRPENIKNGEGVQIVQREVANILQGRILVGHALHNDLKILLLDHPKKKIRDTQKYKPFKTIAKSGRPSLKVLCREVLNVNVQQGEHSSVQDAQATMRLYTMVKKQWEAEIKVGKKNKNTQMKNEKRNKCEESQKSDEL